MRYCWRAMCVANLQLYRALHAHWTMSGRTSPPLNHAFFANVSGFLSMPEPHEYNLSTRCDYVVQLTVFQVQRWY